MVMDFSLSFQPLSPFCLAIFGWLAALMAFFVGVACIFFATPKTDRKKLWKEAAFHQIAGILLIMIIPLTVFSAAVFLEVLNTSSNAIFCTMILNGVVAFVITLLLGCPIGLKSSV
jgi:hypothetical protein